MATAQLASVSPTTDERERRVQSEYREDHYFRLHVARVQESESALDELPRAKGVPHSPLRSNETISHSIDYDIPGKPVPNSFDNHRVMNGLSLLPLAGHSLAELERETIQQTLKLNGGHRKITANILGISVRTLQRKLKEYGNGFV